MVSTHHHGQFRFWTAVHLSNVNANIVLHRGRLENIEAKVGNAQGGQLQLTAAVPAANNAYDLGTATLRWRNLYLSGNAISFGDGAGAVIDSQNWTYLLNYVLPAVAQPVGARARLPSEP
jgi:hypothetical protein